MGRTKEKRIDPAGFNRAIQEASWHSLPIKSFLREALGISRSTLNDWTRRGIPERRLVDVARALEISPGELVAPRVPPCDGDESAEALMAMYRAMGPDDRALIWHMARSIAERDALQLERLKEKQGECGIKETVAQILERALVAC